MKLLDKILVPVDVNMDYSEQLSAAIKIAKEYKSEVSVIYVLPDSGIPAELIALLEKYIGKTLDKVGQALHAEKISNKKPVILYGDPTDKILQMAGEEKSNLILVGSGSHATDETFKFGTTAEKLVRSSDVPVWVVKLGQKTDISNIICPVDFSDASKRALKNAVLLANNFKAKLRVLGIYEPITTTSPRLGVDHHENNTLLLNQFREKMEVFLGHFELKEIDFTVDIQTGTPHQKILQAIKKYACDLLVMGTNGRSGFSRLMMGSVTEKVIRELPCSFVTTKTQDIFKLRFDTEIKEIETHFNNACDLHKSGLYREAINQCQICLQINDMHVPSMYKLAELHKIVGDHEKVAYYEKMAKDLLQRLWDRKIDYEIRKHYKPKT